MKKLAFVHGRKKVRFYPIRSQSHPKLHHNLFFLAPIKSNLKPSASVTKTDKSPKSLWPPHPNHRAGHYRLAWASRMCTFASSCWDFLTSAAGWLSYPRGLLVLLNNSDRGMEAVSRASGDPLPAPQLQWAAMSSTHPRAPSRPLPHALLQ